MSYGEILEEYCRSHPEVMVLTAENRALIRQLPHALGSRFVDTGITEQTMIGMAAGLALQGRKVICHALAAFLTMRAFEFIRTDVGISGLPVKLTGYVPGALSDANGPTHQAIEDMALMLGIPDIGVYCPADAEDMALMLETVWDTERPAYLRAVHLSSGLTHAPYEHGKAEWFKDPPNAPVVFLVAGLLFSEVVKASEIMEKVNVPASVVNIRSLRPLDENTLRKAFGEHHIVVCVEDHFERGGLYSLVREWLVQNPEINRQWLHKNGSLSGISFGDKWFKPALLPDVLKYHGMSSSQIAEKVLRLAKQPA